MLIKPLIIVVGCFIAISGISFSSNNNNSEMGASQIPRAIQINGEDLPAHAPSNKAIVAKALLNAEIKAPRVLQAPPAEAYKYTQTEAYLAIMLPKFGETFNPHNLLESVKLFMAHTTKLINWNSMTPEMAVNLIQNEARFSPYSVFYNGLRASHNFSYDCIEIMRSIIEIRGTDTQRRTVARMFDAYFTNMHNIDDLIQGVGANDTSMRYKRRAASTNMFLFGNTFKADENTIEYMTSSFSNFDGQNRVYPLDEVILLELFEVMGFTDFKDRVKKYAQLYVTTEAFYRRLTIQQVFLTPDAVCKDTYLSKPFAEVLELAVGQSEKTKSLLPLLRALREDPIKASVELAAANRVHPDHIPEFVDRLQARLMWNPSDIKSGDIVIKAVDDFDLTAVNDSSPQIASTRLYWELTRAKSALQKLIIEDLADWLTKTPDELSEIAAAINAAPEEQPSLLRLKKMVNKSK